MKQTLWRAEGVAVGFALSAWAGELSEQQQLSAICAAACLWLIRGIIITTIISTENER